MKRLCVSDIIRINTHTHAPIYAYYLQYLVITSTKNCFAQCLSSLGYDLPVSKYPTIPSLAVGQEVLKVLEMDEESGFRVCEGQGDAAEAASRVRTMLHDLHLLTTAVEACWRRLNTALDTYMQVKATSDTVAFFFSS